MSCIFLLSLLSVIRAQRVSLVPSCPASCVVCSEEAIICHRLAYIIDAPHTTQALLLTEGSISAVQSASLSDLSNVTVIGLSHNLISALGEMSFRNLPFLHTLLLDHNLLASQALEGGVLTNLTRLEVLALGHNLIGMIQGGWFKGSKALRSLKLEGNLLTSLDSGSFPLNDLGGLESLDLSENLIDHLHRNSFAGLVRLQTLDLSRNRLSSAPAEAFSYLSWLTNLNLDLNSWNCSCQLLDLAALLTTFIQQPDKTLNNGQRMVCVSADNPAVTTVLELTEANCVPSNQNITVRIEARGSVTPQRYAQDVAITAVICFTGGVCLTLLVVLIIYHVSRSKKLKESKRRKEEERRSSTVENHPAYHRDVGDKRREFFWQAHRHQPWDREAMTIDAWTEGPGGQFESRTDSDGYFRCSHCSSKGQRGMGPTPMRWNERTRGKMETEEERQTREMRRMMMEERRRLEQRIIGRDIQDKVLPRSNANSSSNPQKETVAQRPEPLSHKTNIETDESNRTDMKGRSREHETLPCESCHRMNKRQGRLHFEGVHPQYRHIGRGRNVNHNEYDVLKNTDLRREKRNVTFDLESSRSLRRKYKREEEVRSCQEKERGKRHKAEVQSSRSAKVKLNLKPLGKNQVHPKMKTELGHSEKKKDKDKRQEAEDRGEREAIGKSGKKTKEKTLNKGPNEVREEVNKAEDTGEEGQESKTSFEQDKGGQESIEDSHHDDTANTADPSPCALPFGQGQMLLGESIQGSVQRPLSISGPNPTDNLSLLGSTSSQPTGSSLPLQGGNSLVPGLLVPTGPAKSVAPLATSGPNQTPRGTAESVSGQPGFGLMSPATSHLANTVYMNTLQAGAIQNSPPPSSQAAGLALSLNPPVDPAPVQSLSQSKPPPDSSPLLGSSVQGLGFSTGVAIRHNVPTQAPLGGDGLSAETPQAPGPVTTVESLSNNSQTKPEEVHAGPTARTLTEGPAAELSGGSVQGADMSESGVSAPSVSTHGVSSTGDTAAVLLQQEYLSEEGGSSPRRKLRLVLPEKTSSRPPTALERKIR